MRGVSNLDDKDFFEKVFEVVAKIPVGKVTTYGAIGKFLGMRSSARMVGWALNSAANRIDLPCHRVVNRRGELTGRRYFATPTLMKELLLAEDIEFIGDSVNMKKHFWEPE